MNCTEYKCLKKRDKCIMINNLHNIENYKNKIAINLLIEEIMNLVV